MVSLEVVNSINNFVAQQPRTIQEVAQLINKNWRTAESYVQKIAKEHGTIAVRTFRGGTRGALKIVYWNLINKNQSSFQEVLFQRITTGRKKSDFSPFDIYQYINEDQRKCFLEKQEQSNETTKDLQETVAKTQRQLLVFSGDLSWSKAGSSEDPILDSFEELVKKGVSIKVLCNVDLNSFTNVTKMLALNHKHGKELIEIRHCQQPLRSFIIDDSFARLKENYFLRESVQNHYLFYSITSEDWVKWMQKVFWHFFSTSISAEKRVKDLESIKQID